VSEINYTQWTGLIGACCAVLSCLMATSRSSSSRHIWLLLTLFNVLFLTEVLAGYRHDIHDVFTNVLRAQSLYDERRVMQGFLVIAAAGFAIMVAGWLMNWARRGSPAEQVAISASLAVFLLLILEVISQHSIDAMLYKHVGPIMLIGWLWLACCIATTCAAVIYYRNHSLRYVAGS